MGFKEFVLGWVLPKDEETLRTWLFIIELFNVLLSFCIIVLIVLILLTRNFLRLMKFGVILIFFVIGLSTLNIMQYLLQIEFNTRKGYILKKRK